MRQKITYVISFDAINNCAVGAPVNKLQRFPHNLEVIMELICGRVDREGEKSKNKHKREKELIKQKKRE